MTAWYSVYTMGGKENKARDLLINRAVAAKFWGDLIEEIFVPSQRSYSKKGDGTKIVDQNLFPGYMFIKMNLTKEAESLVRGTDGISGFVKSGSRPDAMPDEKIQKIKDYVKGLETEEPLSRFAPGDVVRIVSGPFMDYLGKVDSVDNTKGKVKAFINIFGRDTPYDFNVAELTLNV